MTNHSLPRPRFLADAMLGRLARWLRALGYDTLYDAGLDDAALADWARRDQRVLLTRDVELTRRRGLRVVLVRADRLAIQLDQLVRELELNDAFAFTRCIECNAELTPMERVEAARVVPPYVLQTQAQFKRCPACGRVFWRGTHWQRMRALLSAMEAAGDRR